MIINWEVNPWNILPGFAIGKFIGDAWVILMATVTADEATDLLHGHVSWQTALTAAAGLLLISCPVHRLAATASG
jgi:hypothetical protein